MGIFDVFVAIVWGIIEGITEWLPVSSTGHMILVEQFLTFQNEDFTEMFLVVVQLGAILAVVILFWERIWPFQFKDSNKPVVNGRIMTGCNHHSIGQFMLHYIKHNEWCW